MRWLALAAFACGSTEPPPPPDLHARRDTGVTRWLAGDLGGAVDDLTAAEDTPGARAMIARITHRAATSPPRLLASISGVTGAAISPDGASIATTDTLPEPTIRVWDTTTGVTRFAVPGRLVTFAPGAIVTVTGSGLVSALEPNGEVRWTHQAGAVADVAVARDHVFVATDAATIAIDLATGATTAELPWTASSLAVSADGGTIVADENVVDVASVSAITWLRGYDVYERAVDATGTHFASAHRDGRVEIADRSGTTILVLEQAGRHVRFLADGTLATVDGDHVTRWNVDTGHRIGDVWLAAPQRRFTLEHPLGLGGHTVEWHDDQLVLVSVVTGQVIGRFGFDERADALAWLPDGSLAIATRDKLLAWSPAGVTPVDEMPDPVVPTIAGNRVGAIETSAPVLAAAVSPDGRTLAASHPGGGIDLWDLPTRTPLAVIAVWRDSWVAITPTGRFEGDEHALASSADGVLLRTAPLGERGLVARVLARTYE